MLPAIVADIHQRVDPADERYFRDSMEKILGSTLEQARERREDASRRLNRTVEPMQAVLKRQRWISGAGAAYADYIVFSVFQWARVMSPHEVLDEGPLREWRERMLDLHDGLARKVPTA
jgi:glutathione S-transferase